VKNRLNLRIMTTLKMGIGIKWGNGFFVWGFLRVFCGIRAYDWLGVYSAGFMAPWFQELFGKALFFVSLSC